MASTSCLKEFYDLLRRTEPVAGEYDVTWTGPWVVERGRRWWPTSFTLYRGVVYGAILTDMQALGRAWCIADGAPAPGEQDAGEAWWAWEREAPRLLQRMRSAVAHPDRYNRHAARWLPLGCRCGAIQRALTWPKGFVPIPRDVLAQARRMQDVARRTPSLPAMTLRTYLDSAALAYDAVFPETRHLSPADKHRRWADTRHGGMLDLPLDDAEAFAAWNRSPAWTGAHPWEIVFGLPLGIHLWVTAPEGSEAGWRLRLSAGAEGQYPAVVRMALALGQAGRPVDLERADEIFRALRGQDDVRVGPRFDQVHLEDLQRERPASVERVRWDPIRRIEPVTPAQRARIEYVERTGTPAGWIGTSS